MDREHIKQRLIEILTCSELGSLQVDVSDLTDDTSLVNDIALDSLQLLELILAMERTFGFRANTRRLNIDIFDRFGSVIDFVQGSLPQAAEMGAGDARHA